MSKKIRNETLEGSFEQDAKFKARDKFEVLIEDKMRESGRVPVLDIPTQWFTSWDDDTEKYEFKLVMCSVYVGKRKAKEEVLGWMQETGKEVLV